MAGAISFELSTLSLERHNAPNGWAGKPNKRNKQGRENTNISERPPGWASYKDHLVVIFRKP
jgi:hypothetical protein